MEEVRIALKILTGKSIRKIPLGKPRCRWEDIVRIIIKGIGISTGNWIISAHHRDFWRTLVNAALKLQVP